VGDDVLAHGALVFEVEVLEGFAGREAGGADPGVAAVGLAGGDLSLKAGGQELLVAPRLVSRPGGEAFDAGEQGRVFQLPAQVGEVAGAAHAAPVAWS
jgi:hypothetical protein